MTIGDALRAADEARPNSIPPEKKMRWLSRLEGRIMLEVFLLDYSEIREYKWPEDQTVELIVKPPYDGLYEQYLEAQIDYENKDSALYADSSQLYEETYGAFVRWFARVYAPAQGYRGGNRDGRTIFH
jgi:hypothetical protein